MNKWKTISVVLLATLLITLTLVVINSEKEKIQGEGPEKIYIGHNEKIVDDAYKKLVDSISTIENEVTDKITKDKLTELIESTEAVHVNLENFNRESAVTALQNIFLEIGEDLSHTDKITEESVNEEENDNKTDEGSETSKEDKSYLDNLSKRLTLLDDEKTDIEDVLSESIIDKLYLSEDFKKEKFNRQFASSALLIYYDIIASNNNEKITPMIQAYDEIVYLDNRFMTAHIPLDLFIGSGTGIAFEVQYVDGEWKLNPYTSMMSLNLMSILNDAKTE